MNQKHSVIEVVGEYGPEPVVLCDGDFCECSDSLESGCCDDDEKTSCDC